MGIAATLIQSIFNTLVIFAIIVFLGNVARQFGTSDGNQLITDTQRGVSGLSVMPPAQWLPIVGGLLLGTFIISIFHHHRKEQG